MITRTMTVPEITCDTCKIAIEGALNPLEGVELASVDIAARQVTVSYDDTRIGPDALVAAIVDQGYDVPARE